MGSKHRVNFLCACCDPSLPIPPSHLILLLCLLSLKTPPAALSPLFPPQALPPPPPPPPTPSRPQPPPPSFSVCARDCPLQTGSPQLLPRTHVGGHESPRILPTRQFESASKGDAGSKSAVSSRLAGFSWTGPRCVVMRDEDCCTNGEWMVVDLNV